MEGSFLVSTLVCKISDVPAGGMKQVNIRGNEVLVVNLNSQFYCLEARCTHAGAPLAEGELKGDVITCPWHGSRFNATNGAVVNEPAERPLKVFSSIVKDNYVYIEL